MFDLKVDNENNLVFVNGELVILEGADVATQDIIQKIQTYKGEWFLNTEEGIPYLEKMSHKDTPTFLLETLVAERINDIEYVTELTSLSLDFDPTIRKLTLNYTIKVDETIITVTDKEIL